VGHEILVENAPFFAKIAPVVLDIIGFNGDGRCAAEAGPGQYRRTDSRHSAPANAVLEHGGMVFTRIIWERGP